MLKERVLVIGLGEVGRPLLEVLASSGNFAVFGFDIDDAKMKKANVSAPTGDFSIMHICFECRRQSGFVRTVVDYVERFKPKLTIINSTVPPMTTEKIYVRCGCHIAHSPIRGVHRNLNHMKWELKRWTKYVGGANAESARLASEHFEKMGMNVKAMGSARETELAKLFETTYRAWMITCFQYCLL